MSSNVCERCGESFSQKAHLTSHMKRKNPCKKDSVLTLEKIQHIIEKKVKEELEQLLPDKQGQQDSLLYAWSKSMLTSCEVVKPPLKWVGGKTQILEQVMKKVPRKINNYYEPHCY